ncbi:hypothetical protein [Haliscomenobacter hydrossis]|uniref:Uncharacterized protein n=1 Tax=Haliscomenobacter hydrossis (strain ATCC 27775 / DSM 1100 / LMG 10767 / O) TaxID=760192 RepID=F4KZG3_HALH1|nr:hypothetical protein [Haliscomenobacter hydrossis]AEE49433.1 hypothetical protein Halhy_1541 [Haliscomenobacter hydrossis DSM 1100]
MEIHFKIIGIVLMVLAFIHAIFPKFFNWDKELAALSLINRQMMVVHTFFIALIVFLMGLLCLSSAHELMETNLGKKIVLGLGIFWSTRLFMQFFGYSADLWKGKRFETTVHILFTLLWTYLSVIFLATYFS